uniref:Thymidylate kinase n=1 Tax=Acrobeloides nanus TaxID=290746 RepID=A0A914BXN9_9BILA
MTRRGALIVFEGLDRSGKTTQTQKLLEFFQKNGKKSVIQRFPDREEPLTGPTIDNFLKTATTVSQSKEVIHLLFSANRWACMDRIRSQLNEGTHVIMDRYSFSGIAYSLAKGMDKAWVCQPEVGLLKPDLVLFFDIDPTVVMARNGFGGEALERSDFQAAVYAKMNEIFQKEYWKKINAAETIENVHEEVLSHVNQVLETVTAEKEFQILSLKDFGL